MYAVQKKYSVEASLLLEFVRKILIVVFCLVGFIQSTTSVMAATAVPAVSRIDAIRLLEQASFGPTEAAIADVQAKGIAGWIDSQLAMPATGYTVLPAVDGNPDKGCPPSANHTACWISSYTAYPVSYQFFKNAVSGSDQLRQRVAFALSQIFVAASGHKHLPAYAVREYQQMLLVNAFGNYRTILENVTLNPLMGRWLDMVNNDLPNSAAGTSPNENYAREVNQLFSIGLSSIALDGTCSNNCAQTYYQDTVEGFAYAFTGWTFPPAPGIATVWPNPPYYIGNMVPVAAHHDTHSKTILRNQVIPAGQTAQQDLKIALDAIANHPNVAPFISLQLIKFLVTGTPSKAYIARVSAVWVNNGSGVRGDVKAVVRAILLDAEARQTPSPVYFGRLLDPALHLTQLFRLIGAKTDGVRLAMYSSQMGQDVFNAPTVFNFYSPTYALPSAPWIVAPQFQIMDSNLSIIRDNTAHYLIYDAVAGTSVDFSPLTKIISSQGGSGLVDYLDEMMTHKTLSTNEKNIILSAMNGLAATDLLGRAQLATYLIATSARHQIAH